MAAFGKKKSGKKTMPKKNVSHATRQPGAMVPISMPEWESYFPALSSDLPDFLKTQTNTEKEKVKSKIDPEKDFLKTFKELTYCHRIWDVWNDFIIMAACALSNPLDKEHYLQRENRYLSIISKYSREEQSKFPELFAHLTMAIELNPEQDFLGKIYTMLNLQDEGREQIFTPYSVCELMGDITMQGVSEQIQEHGYISINDPCCGAGATLIAGVHSARKILTTELGLNFQNHILVTAQDIDETVALMCYIQLSLLGVAGYVKVGNTITEPMSNGDTTENYWFTPIYFSDVWAMRRLAHKLDNLFQSVDSNMKKVSSKKRPFRLRISLTERECHCSILYLYELVAQKAGFSLAGKSIHYDCTKIRSTQAVQDAVLSCYKGDLDEIPAAAIMLWAGSGPKADLEGDDYAVEIEDGFVREGDANDV